MTPGIYIAVALIGALSALLGVGGKMLFDLLAERRQQNLASNSLFIEERREVFDRFLEANRQMVRYRDKLHDLVEISIRGENVPEGTLENFPDSPMSDLVDALERVRRIAKTYPVVQAADSIVRLYADMSAFERKAMQLPSDPDNKITWFLLCRFSEDRVREFVYAYRAELGLGVVPEGAPAGYMAPIHPDLNSAESTLRRHIMPHQKPHQGGSPKSK